MKKLERKMSRRKRSGTVERPEPKHFSGESATLPLSPKASAKKAGATGAKSSKVPSNTSGKKHKDAHSKEPTKGSATFPPAIPVSSKSAHSHKSSHHSADGRVTLFGTKVKYQESQGFSPSLTKSAELGETNVGANDTKTSASDNSLPHSLNGSLTTRFTPSNLRKKPKTIPDTLAINIVVWQEDRDCIVALNSMVFELTLYFLFTSSLTGRATLKRTLFPVLGAHIFLGEKYLHCGH
ncbi:unnamed protein product [Allacma fusca]|uniref:Uncharacterized protein n=1 Tax=Allacma fusca TaxID=39272 RepID=A0A8J2PIW8_9HEXA|nr:unnamed protein product [Allacma fusca]